jgi:exonuclease III
MGSLGRELSVKIITQNVHSFTSEKEEELINRFSALNIWAACLQETWQESSICENQEHIIIRHGPDTVTNRAGTGVAIVLSPHAKKSWEAAGSVQKAYGSRILSIKLKTRDCSGKPLDLILVCTYAPHSSKPIAEQKAYIEQLENCLRDAKDYEIMIIGTDANARLSKKKAGIVDDGVSGYFGADKNSTTGTELRSLLAYYEYCSASTFYKKRDYATWRNYQIDHIFIQQKNKKRIRDCGTTTWPGVDSDHRAVSMTLAIARNLKKRAAARPKSYKPDLRLLRNCINMQKAFNDAITKNREEMEVTNDGNTETLKIDQLKDCMTQAGEEIIPQFKQQRKEWFREKSAELEPLVAARNKATIEYKQHPSQSTKRALNRARQQIKKAVTRARKTWYSNLTDIICNKDGAKDFTAAECWEAIRLLERGDKSSTPHRPMQFRKSDGSMSASMDDNREVLESFLDKQFNRTVEFDQNIIDNIKLRPLRAELDKMPTDKELRKAVTKLKNGKACGDDGIPAEYYKALETDNDNWKSFTAAIEEIWKSGSYQPSAEDLTSTEEAEAAAAAQVRLAIGILEINDAAEAVTKAEQIEDQKRYEYQAITQAAYMQMNPMLIQVSMTALQEWNMAKDMTKRAKQTQREVEDEVLTGQNVKDETTTILDRARVEGWTIKYDQERNPHPHMSFAYYAYEYYKTSTTLAESRTKGSTKDNWKHDYNHKFLTIMKPPPGTERDALEEKLNDEGGILPESWKQSRVSALPKKGDLHDPKNWRFICVLDVASKIVSKVIVARLLSVFEDNGMDEQCGFRQNRGTIDGLFNTIMSLQQRKQKNIDSWVLFIDLVKAFDTVSREALFAILRRYGLPDHFVNMVIRLHSEAKLNINVGDVDAAISSLIGVRQGSCEGPVLFLFMIQAVMETTQWPAEIKKPQFRTREKGEVSGTTIVNEDGAFNYEFWVSLFADDCALTFNSRTEIEKGTEYINNHLSAFGLQMHKGEGSKASKTEAMFIPGFKRHYHQGDTSNIFFLQTGDLKVYHVTFAEKFKYLGSIIHHSLESEWDITNRINAANGAMQRLKPMLQRIDIDMKVKGRIYSTLVLNILLYGSECWSMKEVQRRRLRVFHARCLRTICKVSMLMTRHKHIPTKALEIKLGIHGVNYYYSTRTLRWAGHIARMPMTRVPRMLLTGWALTPQPYELVAPRCRLMNWGKSLLNTLFMAGISKEFSEWSLLAQNKASWRTAIKYASYEPAPDQQPQALHDYTCGVL